MLFTRLLTTICVTVCLFSITTDTLQAQGTAARPASQATPAAQDLPTKIGLIDMGHLFNEYQRFKDLREGLKAEIQKTDEAAKAMVEQIQAYAKQLQSENIKKGSPDYEKIEAQVIKLQTDLNVMKQKAQRDFMKKETDIYKAVYIEVASTVEQYARYYKYTMVIRFSREKVEESDDPRQLIQNMNNQIVFFNNNVDITDQVLKYLNDRYTPTGKTSPSTATGNNGTSLK